MSQAAAAEFALMLTAAEPQPPGAGPGLGQLSTREQELVTLVAQGRTNAQIAAQLYISIRTVSSHLDRIRDKTEPAPPGVTVPKPPALQIHVNPNGNKHRTFCSDNPEWWI